MFLNFTNVIYEHTFVPDVVRVIIAGSDRICLSSPVGFPDCGIRTPVPSKIIEDLKELVFMWVLSITTPSVTGERFMRSKGKAEDSIRN